MWTHTQRLSTVFCPVCTAEVPESATACTDCGAKLHFQDPQQSAETIFASLQVHPEAKQQEVVDSFLDSLDDLIEADIEVDETSHDLEIEALDDLAGDDFGLLVVDDDLDTLDLELEEGDLDTLGLELEEGDLDTLGLELEGGDLDDDLAALGELEIGPAEQIWIAPGAETDSPENLFGRLVVKEEDPAVVADLLEDLQSHTEPAVPEASTAPGMTAGDILAGFGITGEDAHAAGLLDALNIEEFTCPACGMGNPFEASNCTNCGSEFLATGGPSIDLDASLDELSELDDLSEAASSELAAAEELALEEEMTVAIPRIATRPRPRPKPKAHSKLDPAPAEDEIFPKVFGDSASIKEADGIFDRTPEGQVVEAVAPVSEVETRQRPIAGIQPEEPVVIEPEVEIVAEEEVRLSRSFLHGQVLTGVVILGCLAILGTYLVLGMWQVGRMGLPSIMLLAGLSLIFMAIGWFVYWRADRLVRQGDGHFRAGDFDGALARYRASLLLGPRPATTWAKIGNGYARQGLVEHADRAYEFALIYDATNEVAWTGRGNVAARTGRYREAVDDYRKALARDIHYAVAWNNLGRTLQASGDEPGADYAYRHATAVDPDYQAAWVNWGTLLWRRGRVEEARRCTLRARYLAQA